MGAEKIRVILDTDIGDDIDDAIALCFALGSPEFDVLGVTTVYGDVQTRARIARRMLQVAGRADVPVIPGCERPLGFDYHTGTAPEDCSQGEAVTDDCTPLPAASYLSASVSAVLRTKLHSSFPGLSDAPALQRKSTSEWPRAAISDFGPDGPTMQRS
jgi:inosine-uridine nucleoside N-ribohydrolase